MPRRERWSIIGAILHELEHEGRRGDQARITNVAVRANLPHDRLADYLADLVRAGMVREARFPQLTEKGRSFLREYRQWTEVLARFGLAGPGGASGERGEVSAAEPRAPDRGFTGERSPPPS